ncbi:unnamed protein product [Rangifer tarandus platyrhynchus]|uniref:Uncharacterized protein n=1 Tax=Rangifer tarandus platyrhynchus TaxID=3082113 RepID=A0ABN8ZJA1_RANTA|nr:unnamed protein product [Rangifer tarandus platyrhynchus]
MTTPWESHEPRVFRAHRRPRVKNGWRGRERPGKQWLAQVRQAASLGASVTTPSELCLPSSPTPRSESGCSSQLFGPELDGLSLCLLSDSLLSPTWSAQSAGVTHEEEGPQGGAGPSAKQQLRLEAGKAGASGNVGFPHGVAWMTGEEKAFLLLTEPSAAVTRRSDEWGAQTLTCGVFPCSVSSPIGSRPETQGTGQVRPDLAAETWVWTVQEARGGAAGLGSWESSRGTGGSQQGALDFTC